MTFIISLVLSLHSGYAVYRIGPCPAANYATWCAIPVLFVPATAPSLDSLMAPAPPALPAPGRSAQPRPFGGAVPHIARL